MENILPMLNIAAILYCVSPLPNVLAKQIVAGVVLVADAVFVVLPAVGAS